MRLRIPEVDGQRMVGDVSGNGQLRVVTGPAFAGNELHLSTARAQWRVTGTAFNHREGTPDQVAHTFAAFAVAGGNAWPPVTHQFHRGLTVAKNG